MKYTQEQIDKIIENNPGWFVSEDTGKMVTAFEFEDFSRAVDFISAVADQAEEMEHHPDIYLYDAKFVQISLFTHDVEGISAKDEEMIEIIEDMMSDSLDESDDDENEEIEDTEEISETDNE